MPKNSKVVTLDPATVQFLMQYGRMEDNFQDRYFYLPHKLKHIELNDFEIIPDPMRYFFVVFSGIHPETGKFHEGHIAFDCPTFPPMYMITEYIVPEITKIKYKGIIIKTLQEIYSREDFEQFIDGGGIDYQLKDILGE